MTSRNRLPFVPLLCYSAGNIAPTAIHGFVGAFLLKFYTDHVDLDPAWVGWALLVRSIVDAAIDPAIGYWSDRSTSSQGRRRPFFLLGTIPAAIFLYLMMIPPPSSAVVVFVYLTLASSLMVSFLSLMAIPHLAMGFELTTDYDERTRIFGYKNLFENLAVLIATFSVPLALNLEGMKWFAVVMTRTDCYRLAAAALAMISVAVSAIAYYGTTERSKKNVDNNFRFFEGVNGIFKNRAFLVLIVVFVAITIADRMITAEMFIVIERFHRLREEQSVPLLIGFFAGGLCSVWPWVWLAGRFGKDVILRLSILLWPLTCVAFVLRPWDLSALTVVAFCVGATGTGMMTILGAIVPDALDYERSRSKKSQEGMYVSVGNVIAQIAMGIGFLIAGQTLHLAGYRGDSVPTVETMSLLRMTFALVPCVLSVVALAALEYFPITKQSYLELIKRYGVQPGNDTVA